MVMRMVIEQPHWLNQPLLPSTPGIPGGPTWPGGPACPGGPLRYTMLPTKRHWFLRHFFKCFLFQLAGILVICIMVYAFPHLFWKLSPSKVSCNWKAEVCWSAFPFTSPTGDIYMVFLITQATHLPYYAISNYSKTIPLAFLGKGSNLMLLCMLNTRYTYISLIYCRCLIHTEGENSDSECHLFPPHCLFTPTEFPILKAALQESSSQSSTYYLLLQCYHE